MPAYLVNDESEIKLEWLEKAEVIGITAGASAPEEIVLRIVNYLKSLGVSLVEGMAIEDEQVHFSIPQELVQLAKLS